MLGEIVVDEVTALMDRATLDSLFEYSCTVPTGVVSGKRWKRGCCGCVARGLRRHGTCKIHDTWHLGEYVVDRPGYVLIKWRKILIVKNSEALAAP